MILVLCILALVLSFAFYWIGRHDGFYVGKDEAKKDFELIMKVKGCNKKCGVSI